jgi:hypothetical protein
MGMPNREDGRGCVGAASRRLCWAALRATFD